MKLGTDFTLKQYRPLICKRKGPRYESEMAYIHQRTNLYSTVKISSQITQPLGRNFQITKITLT
jgi:hypothetical protein